MSSPQKKQSSSETVNTKKSTEKTPKKNYLAYGFSIFILVIIIISFVVAPVTSTGNSSQNIVFGSYAGEDITLSQGSFLQKQYSQIYSQLSGNGNSESQNQYTALRSAYDNAVMHTALLHEAKKLGYTVTDNELSKALREYPVFLDEEGNFSSERYKAVSAMELNNIRSLLKDDILIERIINAYTQTSELSEKEKADLMKVASWERSFRLLSFNSNDYPDSEVKNYLSQHSDDFKARELSVITLSDKESLDQLKKDLEAGLNNFESYATEHSKDLNAAKAGKKGKTYISRLKMELINPEDADKIFALGTGSLSEAVQVPSGYALYRADTDAVAANPESAEDIQEIREYLNQYEKGTIQEYIEKAAQSAAEAARSESLDQEALALGKTIQETNSFPINFQGMIFPSSYGNFPVLNLVQTTDNQALSDAQNREEFFTKAFSLKEGEISDPIVLEDQVVILSLLSDNHEASTDMFGLYLPMLVQYYNNDDLRSYFIKPALFNDKFLQVYREHFMN